MACAYYGVRPGTLATAHPRKLGGDMGRDTTTPETAGAIERKNVSKGCKCDITASTRSDLVLMNPPKIFISATSGDLSRARQIANKALLTINCPPREQTHFKLYGRNVTDMLRRKISGWLAWPASETSRGNAWCVLQLPAL